MNVLDTRKAFTIEIVLIYTSTIFGHSISGRVKVPSHRSVKVQRPAGPLDSPPGKATLYPFRNYTTLAGSWAFTCPLHPFAGHSVAGAP